VRGTLAQRNGTHGEVRLGALALWLPHRALPDGDVDVSIRPEAITLRAPGATSLAGTVRKAAYLGGSMEYTLDTGIGALFAVSMAVDRPYAVGDAVSIELAQHGIVLVPPERAG
jgi:iron(III) transport system ATP-binding protein